VIWVPPKVSKELRANRAQMDADIIASLEPGDPPEPWNSELKQLDPRLYLARAKGHIRPGLPMKPGYWHVLRDNSDRDAGLSVTPIEDAIGGFAEPSSRLIEMMRQNDLQRAGAIQERENYRLRRELEEKRQHASWLDAKVQGRRGALARRHPDVRLDGPKQALDPDRRR
jgi:hypothetical protein